MPQRNDLSRSAASLDHEFTLIAVIEMSQSSWLVAAIVPGIERHPLKKLEANEEALLQLLRRWQGEAAGAGRTIARVAVAFEAGRDGFWLARWLRAHGIEAHVIYPTSVAVRASIGGRRRTGSTPGCSGGPSSAGCAASRTTAAWSRSRRSRKRTPSARTGSGRA